MLLGAPGAFCSAAFYSASAAPYSGCFFWLRGAGRRQGRWKQALGATLLEELQATPHGFQYEETASHLLRAVRNTVEHVHDWGQEAQQELGTDKVAILEYYFCGRFPRLLLGAWGWACRDSEFLEDVSLAGAGIRLLIREGQSFPWQGWLAPPLGPLRSASPVNKSDKWLPQLLVAVEKIILHRFLKT